MRDLTLGLPAPRLLWSADGAPHNCDHDDGYFSDVDGAAESRAVFLQGCHLPQSWADKSLFTIGELGFGTGLNFLSSWDLWRRQHLPGARMHFISIEGAPFDRDELERAHSAFSPLQGLAKKLRAAWPPRVKGVHRLFFDEDGVTLTLYFMDVDEALNQMEAKVDAWFLDGFAPSKNTNMWSESVFSHLARLSHEGTRAATFSVAGKVRRGLTSAGFNVSRQPGHGRKRERLEAIYTGPVHQSSRRQSLPFAPALRENAPPNNVLIIGGGIAAASVAHGFLRRNIAVTIVSKDGLGDEASGNPAALISPRLDLDDAPPARFFRTAFVHAANTYANLGPEIWTKTGLLRLPVHPSDHQKFTRLAASEVFPASEFGLADQELYQTATGQDRHESTLYLPNAGIVRPKPALEALTREATKITGDIARLERIDEEWVAYDGENTPIARAPIAILALGSGTLAQTKCMDFQPLKGQISVIKLAKPYIGPAMVGNGYALALDNTDLLIGATYEPVDPKITPINLSPQAAAHEQNLQALQTYAPQLAMQRSEGVITGRVSLRAATPDQMPYAGALVDEDDFISRFAGLKHGFLDPKAGNARLQDGLFTLMGLGARGFALAPILGEAIAAEVLGEPSPLERGTAQALHPARVLARRLKYGT